MSRLKTGDGTTARPNAATPGRSHWDRFGG